MNTVGRRSSAYAPDSVVQCGLCKQSMRHDNLNRHFKRKHLGSDVCIDTRHCGETPKKQRKLEGLNFFGQPAISSTSSSSVDPLDTPNLSTGLLKIYYWN